MFRYIAFAPFSAFMAISSQEDKMIGAEMKSYAYILTRIIPLLCVLTLPVAADTYDIVIQGGRVLDPETSLDAKKNIGIENGRISVITDNPIKGKKVLDANGLIVSPGFIDMHAHGQTIPAARMQAMDGVTTGLELEAGVLPIAAYYNDLEKEGRPINYGASVNWASARIAAHMNVKPRHEIDWFFSNFKDPEWQSAISSDDQLSTIASFLSEGLDQGGLGVGFLLGYAPGTGRKEYFEMSKLAAGRNVPTYTHARFLSMLEPESSFEGMAEVISVAASTGVHAHIVHLNSMSLSDIEIIKPLILGAQKNGVTVTTEAYPYGAGSTGIGAAMFQGSSWRESMGGVSANNFEIEGKRLTEEQFAYLQKEKPETEIIIHFLDVSKPEDQAKLDASILLPGGVIGSDGGTWQVGGAPVQQDAWPLPEDAWSHPRSAGTYARFLRQYVRENKSVTLMEAIERISYGPAKMLEDSVPQMKQKGRIQVGADADIVVFDITTVSDRATYAKPAQTSEGFHHIIVNGVLLVEDGTLNTNIMPGRAIRNEQVN